jgi:hypothetical protein
MSHPTHKPFHNPFSGGPEGRVIFYPTQQFKTTVQTKLYHIHRLILLAVDVR